MNEHLIFGGGEDKKGGKGEDRLVATGDSNYVSVQAKLGDLLLSLSYFPSNNTLALGVVKVITKPPRNCTTIRITGKESQGKGYQWKIR